jgi:GNAT superfamily N-acetyltransferase
MPTPPVTIRPVEARDVPGVERLLREVLAEFGLLFGEGSETDAQVLALPESYARDGGAFWVAEDAAGALVGTCGVSPLEPGVYELRKMYLHRDARGLGAGRRLLDQALAFAQSRGAARMVLDTTHQMTQAIVFYEAHGFVRDDRWIRGARCSRGYVRELSGGG